tara:strand:+ start:1119 stop:1724 length:606 start_codon:yes stop_codon:yes gene_type:complete
MRGFYDPNEFSYLAPIINAKDLIVEELNACRNQDMFLDFLADFKGNDAVEKVVGTWVTSQMYYRKAGSHKIHTPTWPDRNIKKKWIKYLRLAPNIFPTTFNILKSVDEVYWAGMSKIQANSEIKPHKHKFKVPTLTFQICLSPSAGNCTLTLNNEKVEWGDIGQMMLFDGRLEHELINDSPDSRTIMHMEIDPTGHPDYKW